MHENLADPRLITMTADDEQLRTAVSEANIPLLLLVLAQFTGEQKWLREPYRPTRTIALYDNDDGGLPVGRQDEIRDAALDAIRRWRDGELDLPGPPSGQKLVDMMSTSLGEQVPPEYAESMAEEAGFIERPGTSWTGDRPTKADTLNVVIIGAGPSGIATAVALRRLGIPFTIVERSESIGGVWAHNDYPGAGVDTPAHIYSFSFAPRRGWSQFYAKQPEIKAYFDGVADQFGIADEIRFSTEVLQCRWNEDAKSWDVEVGTRNGTTEHLRASVVISCVGVLTRPSIPQIAGIEQFRGPVFHTSRWDHSLDLTGKRVAVIGTGATSMQLVPAIVDAAAKVLVFQRSPQWMAPNPNYKRPTSAGVLLMMEQVPYYAAFYRLRQIWQFQDKLLPSLRRDPDWPHKDRSVNAENDKTRIFFTDYITKKLGDRTDLLDKVLPTYPPYGKRILMDNDWIETITRDDVTLVTDAVAGVDVDRITTASGDTYGVDVIVLATGFQSSKMLQPMDVRGRSGTVLREVWHDDDPFAYLGVAVPEFPNFFMVGGPHTAGGHGGSAIFSAEVSISYISQLLMRMAAEDLDSVEVRADVTQKYNEMVDDEHEKLIWTHPGMTVWYKNARGRVVANMPWRGVDFWSMCREPDLADYLVEKHS